MVGTVKIQLESGCGMRCGPFLHPDSSAPKAWLTIYSEVWNFWCKTSKFLHWSKQQYLWMCALELPTLSTKLTVPYCFLGC